MHENLNRCAHIGAGLEVDVALRRIQNDLATTIGKGSQRMAEQVASADRILRHLEIKLAGQAVRGKRFCEPPWSAQAGNVRDPSWPNLSCKENR